MLVARQNESPELRFRSQRIFSVDGNWYFHTREGIDIGPYASQFDAEVESGLLGVVLRDASPGPEALDLIKAFAEDMRSFQMDKVTVTR